MKIDLDQIERVAREATPGPWTHDLDLFRTEDGYEACITDEQISMLATIGTDVAPHDIGEDEERQWTQADSDERDRRVRQANESQAMRDAAFIAQCSPDVVLALVARIRELEQAAQPVRKKCICTHEAGDSWPCEAHPGCNYCGRETPVNTARCPACIDG